MEKVCVGHHTLPADNKFKFNEVPDEYDKWRPTYVSELYADIMAYSGLTQGSRALEVGIGTGQATLPILETNCRLTAVELGAELAEYTRKKFHDYKNFEIISAAFEDYEFAENSLDLIYSASAFHWVPENIGYQKVYKLLKPGGAFARFAVHPYKDKENEALHLAIQEVYAKYMPDSSLGPEWGEEMAGKIADIAKKYGFVDIDYKLYHQKRVFDAESYAALISTYSPNRALGEERLEGFTNEIKEAINRCGGKINIYDTLDLQLARKPKGDT